MLWHLVQKIYVSLQLSEQKGIRHNPYAPTVNRRQMHQATATQPIFFLPKLPV